jgi:hypothetical protein
MAPADPSPEEAAAIVAAVERFLRDHAAASAAEPEHADPWRRAALLEGVGRAAMPPEGHPWINT